MRLIDADALIADLYDEKKHNNFMAPFKLCTADIVDLKFLLNEAPTVDAVPVVRCGECKRWTPDGGYGLDLDGTKRLYGICGVTEYSHKETHYCSYGKRREDND